MKTLKQELPKRFEQAVTKLYNAFHTGDLNAYDCEKCAVGNICGNSNWSEPTAKFIKMTNTHTKFELVGNDIFNIENTGYSAFELRCIEKIFMFGILGGKMYFDRYKHIGETKHNQFRGLCAVIEYLCELDGIPNIMDYKSLFEVENDKAVNELTF